jgi:hypothetical protein
MGTTNCEYCWSNTRLESVLRSFVAISEGDSLQIKFDDNVFDFDVLGMCFK